MLVLAVETATNQQSVAVLKDQTILGSRSREAQGSHTRWLIPTVDDLLSSLELELNKIDGLAFSIGPGSFTGLRAGLAAMLGFRVALELPLVVVPTLEAMAWNFQPQNEVICPMIRARAGEVYWACFRWENSKLIRVTEDQASTLNTLVQSIQEPTWAYGEGWVAHQHELLEHTDLLKPASSNCHANSAASVGLASIQRFMTGDFAPKEITPRYILPSYAEMNKSEKNTCP